MSLRTFCNLKKKKNPPHLSFSVFCFQFLYVHMACCRRNHSSVLKAHLFLFFCQCKMVQQHHLYHPRLPLPHPLHPRPPLSAGCQEPGKCVLRPLYGGVDGTAVVRAGKRSGGDAQPAAVRNCTWQSLTGCRSKRLSDFGVSRISNAS